jgi:hypothetical protein
MAMSFFRKHFHLLLGSTLLLAGTGGVLALYFDVPTTIKNRVINRAAAECPMHAQAQGAAGCDHSKATTTTAAGTAAKTDAQDNHSGCCPTDEKSEQPAARILPAGHPPVAGWTVATNSAATK